MAQRTQRVALTAAAAIIIEPQNIWRKFTLALEDATGGPAWLGFTVDLAVTNGFALPVASVVDIYLEPNTPLFGLRGTAGDALTFIEYTRIPPFQA